jgi:hypothetical protein
MPHADPDDSTEPGTGAGRRPRRTRRHRRRHRRTTVALLLGAALLLPARLLPELPTELQAAIAQLEDADLPPRQALAAARILIARLPPAAVLGLALESPDRRRLLAGLGRAAEAARAGAADPAAVAPDGPGRAGAAGAAGAAADRPIADYLAAWGRERGRELARRGSWTAAEAADLAAQQLVDPQRFVAEPAFRSWVLALLPRELDPAAPARLRDDLLLELERLPAIDFAAAEALEDAWGAAPRPSAERLSAYGGEPLRFDDDAGAPIAASVFSLPSAFFDPPVAAAFLNAVRSMSPHRDLVALVDLPMRRYLEKCCRSPRLHLLETYGRSFSPWPRDPMSLVRRPDGGVVVLVRPNVQPGREEDRYLGAELVRLLPPQLDRAWGSVRWEVAPVPFHNGHVLLAGGAAWISMHTLELGTLALLGLDRVPVASFNTAAGIDRYFAAAARAAAELARLLGRPVRFVHPLPRAANGGASAVRDDEARHGAAPDSAGQDEPLRLAANYELVKSIGGGAGYDLDSIVTLLPAPRREGRPAALVASLTAGRSLLSRLTAEDWDALRRGYDLGPAAPELAAALGAAQQAPAAARLDGFLDLVAAHLAAQGFRVERLPLLVVPVRLLADSEGVSGSEFLLSWNNVVLETTREGRLRAEGFSSLLPSGDALARRTFAAAGCSLDLLPALVHSIVLNGGYRCASNHLRERTRG